ncbi:transposase [Aliarcobacter butzleri]|uniref:transposase n=1 Tax=Aliarcobacter butzleri TaxID=28197 RepID=UPI00344B3CC3
MVKNIIYKEFRHSNYNLVFTLLISTFMKERTISKKVEVELLKIIYNIFENHNNCVVNDVNFTDESTLIISFESTPNIQLSSLVNNFKTVSSRLIRKKFNLDKNFWEQKYYLHTNNVPKCYVE